LGDTVLLIEIVINCMTLIFLGTSVSIFGTADLFRGPNFELPQLQPILARLTANLL